MTQRLMYYDGKRPQAHVKNLVVDTVNERVGIGTDDPVKTLSVHTDKPESIANPDLSNIGGSYPIAQFMVSNVISGANRGIILGGPSGGITGQPVYLQWTSGVPFQIVDPEGNYKVTVNTSNTGTIDFYSKTNDPVNDYVKSLYIGSTTYPIKSERFAGSSGCMLFEGDSSATGAPKVTFQDVSPSKPNQGVLGFNDTANTFSFSSGVNAGLIVTNTHRDGTDDIVNLYFGLGRTADTLIIPTPAIKFGKENQWTGTQSTVNGYLSFSTISEEVSEERMRITSDGNVAIGNSLLFSPNEELHIRNQNDGGDVGMRIQNSTTTAGSTATLYFTTTTNDAFNSAFVGSNRNNSLLLGADQYGRITIQNDGNTKVSYNPGSGNIYFQDETNGASMFYIQPAVYTGSAPYNYNTLNCANSSHFRVVSGGADRFEVKSDGNIIMPTLPTSSTGLPSGALWNDVGTLKIAP